MTDQHLMHDDNDDFDSVDTPLDPWMAALVSDSTDDVVVPRELMWARIRRERTARLEQARRRTRMQRTVMGVVAFAATLVIGIGLGRMSMPHTSSSTVQVADVATADSQPLQASSPVRIAMHEHLVKTALLLTSLGTKEPDARPQADIAAWSRELLTTTRMLLDAPEAVQDDTTRRLLEDLELVLMQIIQSRGTSAPEARRAPSETIRETNLLPRVRAAVTTASAVTGEFTLGGRSE